MAQIQVRDSNNTPLPRINIRISEGVKSSDEALYDIFTDLAGNTGWPIPFWPAGPYTLHVNKANVDPRFKDATVPTSIPDPDDSSFDLIIRLEAQPQPNPNPPPAGDLTSWPRYGMSISGLILNPRHNVDAVIAKYVEAGVNFTRINLLATSWVNPANVMPFHFPVPYEAKWDIFNWNQEYFDRAAMVRAKMNAAGIVCQFTFLELYSWSRRKDTDKRHSPWRDNINNVLWGGDLTQEGDSDTLAHILPDEWCHEFLKRVVPVLNLNPNVLEVGNEFPEKGLHYRVRDMVRSIDPNALVSVNRNEETPGQWANMKIARGDFDFLAYHGNKLKDLDDLDRKYPKSQSSVPTFRELLDDPRVIKRKLIFSSDGARISDDPVHTYDYDDLKALYRELKKRGCSIEHQSRAKMTDEPNHHMLEVDWFKSVIE